MTDATGPGSGQSEVLDQCDECGADLLYHGNRWGRDETVCDGCYGRLEAMRR